MAEETFDSLGIKEEILRGVYAYGFEQPSAIQVKAIPHIIEGKDIVGQAQSGTGKTGAFSIGSLCRIDETKNETQLLVLTPTRELTNQVHQVITEITSYTKITCCQCVGGSNVSMCAEDLRKNPHVVIGTPGRVIDMMRKNHLVTEGLRTVVMDGAD